MLNPIGADRIGAVWGHTASGDVTMLSVYRSSAGLLLSGELGEYMTTDLSLSVLVSKASDWFELQSAWLVLDRSEEADPQDKRAA